MKVIASNKTLRKNYILDSKYEAGIVLEGFEVKSIRQSGVNLDNSYIIVSKKEARIYDLKIAKYKYAPSFLNQDKTSWKLLLHKEEIRKLAHLIKTERVSLIPNKIYFTRRSLIKISFYTTKPIKKQDKREIEKQKEFLKEKQLY